MYTTIFWYTSGFTLVSIGIGLALKKFFGAAVITKKDFFIVTVATVVAGFTVFGFGYYRSKEKLLTFNQNINGWEISTRRDEIKCSRNGSCQNEYDCDSYVVSVPYNCNCRRVNNSSTCDTCYRNETRWNRCPYTKREFNYYVNTNLGTVTVKVGVLPQNYETDRYEPDEYRYSSDRTVPQNIINEAGVGDPQQWFAAYSRVNSGRPGPVTIRNKYKNYILASNSTILKEHSLDINNYISQGLLPKLRSNLDSIYGRGDIGLSNRFYEVGTNLQNTNEWSSAVSYLSSAIGYFLQGDLILVVVNNSVINNDPDTYVIALRAYWSDTTVFEDNSLAKNAVVIVIGTEDNQTVKWARGFSLMPSGNELLFAKISRLSGEELNPNRLIGDTRVGYTGPLTPPYNLVSSGGRVEDLFFGLSDSSTRYVRSPMSFFTYLQNDVELSNGQISTMWVIAILICIVMWIIVVVFDFEL